MPINLRYRLRWLPDKRLAAELEDVLTTYDQLNAELAPKSCFDHIAMRFMPSRMRRPFVRHRWPYRAKAALFALMAADCGDVWPAIPLFLWLAGKQQREEMLKPFSLFVVRCELEDLLDETERRLRRRNGRAAVS